MEESLAIGDVAARAGVSVPTVRYYESRGLLSATRNAGNQRRYPRSALRRLAFVAAAQRVGLSLEEIAAAMATLPEGRTPTRADWTRLSAGWRRRVDERISELQGLRDDLDGCIGCGCLSLRRCALYNPGDEARREGAGARWVRAARGTPAEPETHAL
jgi:MerR family transcriptional regulator, redox-sensitive transcriptional activator SoxR